MMRRLFGRLFMLAMTVALATGCGVGLADLPLPDRGGDSGNTYRLTVEFANALNLPTQATVKLHGTDVGSVDSMSVHDYVASVGLRIRSDVAIPAGTRAELRSATPLGDVFVALTPPGDTSPDAPMLLDGDRIPLRDTGSAATVEEVLAASSLLVNGGVLRDLTTIVNGLGRTVGDRGDELARLISQSTRLISRLSARSSDIRAALDNTDRLLATMAARRSTIGDAVAAAGPALDAIAANTDDILGLIARVGRISTTLSRFPSIKDGTTQHLTANLNRISRQLSIATHAPGADVDKMNKLLAPVLKITSSTAAHVDADLEDLAVGAIADPRHRADPGSRLPQIIDAQNFVGTLAYSLERLRKRLVPPR